MTDKEMQFLIKDVQEKASVKEKISSHTHNSYKYPACFHPDFCNAVIRNFSKHGDYILDPFIGGGTVAVEAQYLHRNLVGVDLNPLAIFSSEFKTIRLSIRDIENLDTFFNNLLTIRLNRLKKQKLRREFFNGIDEEFIDLIGHIKFLISKLRSKKSKIFATGVLLNRSRLTFDNPKKILNRKEFIKTMFLDYGILLDKHLKYQQDCNDIKRENKYAQSSIKLIKGSIIDDKTIDKIKKIKKKFNLIITSPPYPLKHILYNKWQAYGRLENYLPQWIINSNEVKSEAYYTMGGRSKIGEELYFKNIEKSFSNIRKVVAKDGLVIQMVGFHNLSKQLLPFLKAMSSAGFKEVRNLTSSFDRRIWRKNPSIKWFNVSKKVCPEVVLFHITK